jgi:hypothetical protein
VNCIDLLWNKLLEFFESKWSNFIHDTKFESIVMNVWDRLVPGTAEVLPADRQSAVLIFFLVELLV